MNLIQYAVLLRGGVAVGRVSHEPHILFGIGVNRAYQFEKSGGPPRIGLATEVVVDIESFPLFNDSAVWTTHPGQQSQCSIRCGKSNTTTPCQYQVA